MNLAAQQPAHKAAIVAAGALPHLVSMLSTGSPSAQEEAAGALMNLAADAPANQEAAAAAGAVLPLVVVLSFGTPPARANAAAALGNLAHGNAVNRRAVLDAQGEAPAARAPRRATGADSCRGRRQNQRRTCDEREREGRAADRRAR